MLRRSLLAAALVALLLPTSAGAWKRTSTLMPGVTYTKEVRWAYGGPLVTHVIRGPRPLGLYDVKPVLSGGTVLGPERLSSMQRRLSSRATVAGVNGDFFTWASGRPNGIFMRDGVLSTRPERSRSSLKVAFDGSLRVRRVRWSGSWQIAGYPAHPLEQLNHPFVNRPGAVLFTRMYGGRTPSGPGALDVVLSRLPPTVANGNLAATVVELRRGGGTAVPRRGGVLQVRGRWWRRVARSEAQPGRAVTFRLALSSSWTNVADAIGGGPALVRRGKPIYRAGEGFTSAVLNLKHPRTAVGQRADGRIMLVVADGRSRASMGLRTWELALEMVRLGAVRAMALDGGGSSTIAFNSRVLNTPSDGSERPVADGLILFYYGVYAYPLAHRVVSPNGDGVLDVQHLAAKIVRPSTVDVRLLRPNGRIAWRHQGEAGRGVIAYDLARARSDGRWRWIAESWDARGRRSQMVRKFTVNNTLGFLRLSRTSMRVYTGTGGKLDGSVALTRRSSVALTISRATGGALVRRLYASRSQGPGTLAFRWDGRNDDGRVVASGTYVVRVRAANEIGRIALSRPLRVTRLDPP